MLKGESSFPNSHVNQNSERAFLTDCRSNFRQEPNSKTCLKDFSLHETDSNVTRLPEIVSRSSFCGHFESLSESSIGSKGTRHVLNGNENIVTDVRRFSDTSSAVYSDTSSLEEQINIDTLEELERTFDEADTDNSGQLELDEFKALLKSKLCISGPKEAQIESLFMKIDWAAEGAITWDEFCTYMQLEYAEKDDSYNRARDVDFYLPAKLESLPHRDPVMRITDTIDGALVACSQGGMVSFWSSNIDLKRTRQVVNTEQSTRAKPKWITDFVIMHHFNKFIVGTGDHEIQFFELSSLEPYCQISGLESVPLRLDYCLTNSDECLIMYGDSEGAINILVIKSTGECLRTWKKMPKNDGFIASISLNDAVGMNVNFIRWNVHGDWVQMLKYYHEIGQVISCSNHEKSALVIGCTSGSTHVEKQLKEFKDLQHKDNKDQRDYKESSTPLGSQDKSKVNKYTYGMIKQRLDVDQTVFKVYKGVKCFDFSKDKNIIVTGGMDRIVRIWNPYVPGKTTAILRGHGAPVCFLFIAEEDNRLFSISIDKCVKVWEIQDQTCLLTIRPKSHKIRGDLQAIFYSNITKTLVMATDQMAALNLRVKPLQHTDIVTSHKEAVTFCIYNPSFKQVITSSENSVIKVWDFETGTPVFEYGQAHGETPITCMTMDKQGRRLITGGRDGLIKIWNYNNGHCLKVLETENEKQEVCSLAYVELHRNKYIVGVGWDRKINMYIDDLFDDKIHHNIQHPIPKWPDDINRGHTEDILSVAHCPPHLLATASYDGNILVWNMVSGNISANLKAPCPQGYIDRSMDGDLNINKILFMPTRAYKKEAASLISSGPRAHIHFWNVFKGGKLMTQFPGSHSKGAMVSVLEINKQNTVLISADTHGFIYQWNLDDYCIKSPTKQPPEVLIMWRAHIHGITSIAVVEDNNILISASVDCTVRMWNMQGHYVGTFGQPCTWDIYNQGTWQHPMVPYDVLLDPMSLPEHPVVAEKQTMHQVIHEEYYKDPESDRGLCTPPDRDNKQQYQMDDDTIAALIRDTSFKNGSGKRQRYEKFRPVRVLRGGPVEYHMLRCEDLDETPQPKTLSLKANKDDPFNFYD